MYAKEMREYAQVMLEQKEKRELKNKLAEEWTKYRAVWDFYEASVFAEMKRKVQEDPQTTFYALWLDDHQWITRDNTFFKVIEDRLRYTYGYDVTYEYNEEYNVEECMGKDFPGEVTAIIVSWKNTNGKAGEEE